MIVEFFKNDEVVVQNSSNDCKKNMEFVATNSGSGVCCDKLWSMSRQTLDLEFVVTNCFFSDFSRS